MAEAVVNTSGEEHYLLPVRIYLRDAPYISTVAEAAVNTSGKNTIFSCAFVLLIPPQE